MTTNYAPEQIARKLADKILNEIAGMDWVGTGNSRSAKLWEKDVIKEASEMIAQALAEAAEAEAKALRDLVWELIEAADNGTMVMESPLINGDPPEEPHHWHHEWFHRARVLASKGGET